MKALAKIKHGHEHADGVVHFFCSAPDAQSVFVAGTFNDWQPDATPMMRDDDGVWTAALALSPGRYEYKFVVDGQWCCEPGCEHEYRGCPKCVPNEFGTMNRVLEVT
jgi:5'-AMP-activated protein kinase regulatory beta subunit